MDLGYMLDSMVICAVMIVLIGFIINERIQK